MPLAMWEILSAVSERSGGRSKMAVHGTLRHQRMLNERRPGKAVHASSTEVPVISEHHDRSSAVTCFSDCISGSTPASVMSVLARRLREVNLLA